MNLPKVKNGQKVRVKLGGDDTWYNGIVEGKERKHEVTLLDYGSPFLACENSIVELEIMEEQT